MKRKNRILSFLCFILSLNMALHGTAMAQVVVSISIPINVGVKITTHPDYYNSNSPVPLQMTGPIVSDLDSDWVLEVIAGGYRENTGTSSVFVWGRNGNVKPGWPVEVNGRIVNTPAVGDLDGDGDLEIIISISQNPPGIGGWLYVWHHDGSLFEGYPVGLDYTPGAPMAGDVVGDFSEEPLVYEQGLGASVCDFDLDGKKEVIVAGPAGIDAVGSGGIIFSGWPEDAILTGSPVTGDVDGDGTPEVFVPIKRGAGNYIYGWHNDGTEIAGWPVNAAGVENTPGALISIADIDGDGISEILSGSNNGWIAGWRLNGTVVFSAHPADTPIYQPIAGDIDNDNDMEILAASQAGNIYCFDHTGNPVEGWPKAFNYQIQPGMVLADIDSDSLGDVVNPVNDLELLYSGSDGRVHVMDLPGDFNPVNIQWGMYGFNPRNSMNYMRDWDTAGWSVFDDVPAGSSISTVYDWTRGGRVIELDGAGLNNSYAFKSADGGPLNSKNTTLQWSMRYNLPFYIYVSVDTQLGRRYLYYTATDGNELTDESGVYIHHGLGGNADNGRWRTFSRSLVTDLKDAEPLNEIVDINAVYVQGSGRIDDVMLLPGLPAMDLVNLAFSAEVSVSSGDETKGFINDGDPDTSWVSDDEAISWVEYKWDEPQKVNKVVIEAVEGAQSGVIFVVDKNGNVYEIEFTIPPGGGPVEVVFDYIDDVVSIVIVFDNEDGPVSVGEIGVYDDPNVVADGSLPEEEYTADSYIQIQNGYFFNPVTGAPWIPHGIAYQTWNSALGQWQTPAELKADLDMMAGMGANAVRADFVWRHIETADGVYDWDRYDMLLEEAQARGIKVFPVIGYQWPPAWFPDEWYTMHPQNEANPEGPWLSDILSYEDPEAVLQFRDFLQAVTERYSADGVRKDLGDAVAGWILGNEFGYLGLWSIEYDGYDPDCQQAFREWLEEKYAGDIGALNARWAQDNIRTPGYLPGYPYVDFDNVDMPIPFGYEGEVQGVYLARDKASWYDLTQWREESIGGFIAEAALAVKEKDPGHLITYSAVGMQWGEEDWRYHTEDPRKIAQACSDIGAPLDFWSINNYPWGLENSELMTGQWGIQKAKYDTGIPVMVTETGFTSTETIYPGIDEDRQASLTRNAIWEALETGAAGVCVFHWNDRNHPWLTQREKGFGIVRIDKEPKPAYFAVRDAFNKMDEIDIGQYLAGSIDPAADIAFLWEDAADTIINRYKAEMNALFGTLERLGYEPGFINDAGLLDGLYLDYEAITLPRNQKMSDTAFELLDDIVAGGVKLHAGSDLPGIMNEYGELRNADIDWILAISDLFGIDPTGTEVDLDLEDDIYLSGYETGSFGLNYLPRTLYYPGIGFNKAVNLWKYRDEISVDGGIAAARFDNEAGSPALVYHFDTAISLFGFDRQIGNPGAVDWTWSDRYDWLKSIYTDADGFNISPLLNVSNKHILVDYRMTADGSVLLSFKNYRADTEETTSVTTGLIVGKTVEDLLTGELVEENSDGTVERSLEPDGHALLLAWAGAGPGDAGAGDPDAGDPGAGDPGAGDPGAGDPGAGGPDAGDPDAGGPGAGAPGAGDPGAGDPGAGAPGAGDPGAGDPGAGDPGAGDPGAGDPGAGNTGTGTEGTGYNIWASGPVILLEEDREKGRAYGNLQTRAVQTDISRVNPKRTYVGNSYGLNNKGSADVVSSEQTYSELPPLEQFRDTVQESFNNDVGVIRVTPKIVPPARLQERITQLPIQPKEKSTRESVSINKGINTWILKVKDWVGNLFKKLQLAYKGISRRYA